MFEHGTVRLTSFTRSEQRAVLDAAEQLVLSTGQDVLRPMLRQGEVVLQVTQHVGMFELGGLRLQVLPKVHRGSVSTEDAARQAMRNLLVMLRYAADLPIHIDRIAGFDQGSDWLEVLTTIFADSLLAEWPRGPVRRYERIQEELTAMRGRLRVTDHLRQAGRHHVLPVEYDEFTTDTPLNRLLLFVVERLRATTRSATNRETLRRLAQWMDEDGVTRLRAIEPSGAARLRLDRLQARYALPLALAQLFVGGAGVNLHRGDALGRSFFFDMNVLFEAFLTGVLVRHARAILPPALGAARVVVQGEGDARPLLIRDSTGRGTLRMKPDVQLALDGQPAMILDFKYKVLDGSRPRAGIGREDLYQMFAYAQRYRCQDVVLVYPRVAGLDVSTLRYRVPEDGGRPALLRVATVDLHHDFAADGIHPLVADLRAALRTGDRP